MTEKQCLKLCKDMINDDKGYLLREIKRLFNSGGVDTTEYIMENAPFALPRILLKTALMNYADEIALYNEKISIKIVKNLRRF